MRILKRYLFGREAKTKEAPMSKKAFPEMLSKHLGVDVNSVINDPRLKMYADFALSANDRGRKVADTIEKCTKISGKRFLDVGCAYGGFLVAFAEHGANEVIGIDVDEQLLKLAEANFLDNNLNPLYYNADILDENLAEQLGKFDIITCNDVIEHVEDPIHAIFNISNLLREGGILYMEIPNGCFAGFLKEDGHFRLPGITLLSRSKAEKYYSAFFDGNYSVGHYKQLSWYFYHFLRNGLYPQLINAPTISDLSILISDFDGATNILDSFSDKRVDEGIQKDIKIRSKDISRKFHEDIRNVLNLKKANQTAGNYLEEEILLSYGTSFWNIIGIKMNNKFIPGAHEGKFQIQA